jgi:hypothetical protein
MLALSTMDSATVRVPKGTLARCCPCDQNTAAPERVVLVPRVGLRMLADREPIVVELPWPNSMETMT